MPLKTKFTAADMNKYYMFRGKKYQVVGFQDKPSVLLMPVDTPLDRDRYAKCHSTVVDCPLVEEYEEVGSPLAAEMEEIEDILRLLAEPPVQSAEEARKEWLKPLCDRVEALADNEPQEDLSDKGETPCEK